MEAVRSDVGWAMASSLRVEVAEEALEIAIDQRKPEGVIHQGSDRGVSTQR
jgi:hypothetical protein